jgi:hypothetical protein
LNVTICGVRGSTPSPGAAHARHGGHTSCVALAHEGGAGVGQVLLFHHDPSRTDDALDAMVADLAGTGAGVRVGAAREGAVVAVCDRATDSLRS